MFNAVFNKAQSWDGHAKNLEEQAGGPMVNPVEMASPAPHIAEQLTGIPGYRDAFATAFPGESDPISLPNVQKAIAVFEATLITPNAPFDRFLKATRDAHERGACFNHRRRSRALSQITRDRGAAMLHVASVDDGPSGRLG